MDLTHSLGVVHPNHWAPCRSRVQGSISESSLSLRLKVPLRYLLVNLIFVVCLNNFVSWYCQYSFKARRSWCVGFRWGVSPNAALGLIIIWPVLQTLNMACLDPQAQIAVFPDLLEIVHEHVNEGSGFGEVKWMYRPPWELWQVYVWVVLSGLAIPSSHSLATS